MDISLFYQLWDRLCASAVTGCSTLNEDFRLKRAVEAFEPLSKANKVFARLYNMCSELFTSENPAPLLADCISLCDALAVTQATFKDNSETHENKGVGGESRNLRYSDLKELTSSFTSGKNLAPDSYKDPRVINLFLKNIKSYSSLSVTEEKYIPKFGRSIIPALKEHLDLSDSKERGIIVKYIGTLAGADENDWYLELIADENNPHLVRESAVECLAYDAGNAEKLLEIYKTEKAAMKDKAAVALIKLNVPEADFVLTKITSGKFAQKNVPLIAMSRNKIAVDYALQRAEETKELLKSKSYSAHNFVDVWKMLANKPEAEDIILELVNQKESNEVFIASICEILLQNIAKNDDEAFRRMIENLYSRDSDNFTLPYMYLIATEDRGKSIMDFPDIIDKYRYNIMKMFTSIYCDSDGNYRNMVAFADGVFYDIRDNKVEKRIADGKIDDIIALLTDDSYLEKSERKIFSKKRYLYYRDRKESLAEHEYTRKCLDLADYTLKRLYESCSPDDKEKIRNAIVDFSKKAIAKCYEKSLLDTLCGLDPKYIIDNPHIVSDVIFDTLENTNSYYYSYEISELPRDLVPELQKVLARLKSHEANKYKNSQVSLQIQVLEKFLGDAI
ncbi:MAG: hypothetical protein K2O60_07050 [Ruminococcus sp.]|nr:hypothetical protein [Ruminococcus sp.]